MKAPGLLALILLLPLGASPEDMILVEGGEFRMNRSGELGEEEGYPLILHDFYLSPYEVTQGEYEALIGRNPSVPAEKRSPDAPVNRVSWYDAVRYCNALSRKEGLRPCYRLKEEEILCDFSASGYRLPTEAEWEYAAAGGALSEGTAPFPGGDSLDDLAWHGDNAEGRLHPVGGKRPNPLGLFDMAGNVREWCGDWHAPYPREDVEHTLRGLLPVNPTGPDSVPREGRKVLRGGSWREEVQRDSPYGTGSRRAALPSAKDDRTGFRVARDFQPPRVEAPFTEIPLHPAESFPAEDPFTALREESLFLGEEGYFRWHVAREWFLAGSGYYLLEETPRPGAPADHRYGKLTLCYEERPLWGSRRDRRLSFFWAYAQGILVLYTENRIAEVLSPAMGESIWALPRGYRIEPPLFTASSEKEDAEASHLTALPGGFQPQSNRYRPAPFHSGPAQRYALKEPLLHSWAEGESPGEEPPWIEAAFALPRPPAFLILFNGPFGSPRSFRSHARAKRLRVTTGETALGEAPSIPAADTPHPQILPLPEGSPGPIRFWVDEVYPGREDDKLRLTALLFLFYPPGSPSDGERPSGEEGPREN